jgi:SAM-dependent methyltransferase
VSVNLPEEFACSPYREANPDLYELSDDELVEHYRSFGETEGRQANALASREDFVSLIPSGADVLEIGPYYSPLVRGPNVAYFDVRSRDAMLERAGGEGFDGSAAPDIDFVSPTGDLGIVDRTFDVVVSSHAIEHQPDLIGHMRSVERLLRPGGIYFVIVPDKRYSYDHFNAESDLADIVEAYHHRRNKHTLRSVLGQSVLSTHNDCIRHWNGDHGNFLENARARTKAGIDAYVESEDAYIDVHAWYFTPASARIVFEALRETDYVLLTLERLYTTRRNTFEFWMVLRKSHENP